MSLQLVCNQGNHSVVKTTSWFLQYIYPPATICQILSGPKFASYLEIIIVLELTNPACAVTLAIHCKHHGTNILRYICHAL